MKNQGWKTLGRLGVFLLLQTGLAACSITPDRHDDDHGTFMVDNRYSAVSQDSRARHLIFHFTVGDMPHALTQLTRGPVSSHYLVPRDITIVDSRPTVLQLVPEDRRAWHAGASYWQGRTNLNDSSIGVEIVNRGYSAVSGRDGINTGIDVNKQPGIESEAVPGTWQPYTAAQTALIKQLAVDIVARQHIFPTRVLGHSDIAPGRKIDPGPLFPWRELAAAGVGAWPDGEAVARHLGGRAVAQPVADIGLLQAQLRQYGYAVPLSGQLDTQTVQVLSAFQMHFRPSNYSGAADAETQAILQALLEKYSVDEE